MKRSAKDSKTTPAEYWESIDEMLLSDWIKCTNGDPRFARKKVEKDSKEKPEDAENWYRIYDVYIERYGLGKLYERILKVMKKKALLEIKYVKTRDRFLLTLISVQKENLRALMQDNGEGMTMEASLVHLSKWYGHHLRPSETTVTEYKNILKEYGKSNKKA